MLVLFIGLGLIASLFGFGIYVLYTRVTRRMAHIDSNLSLAYVTKTELKNVESSVQNIQTLLHEITTSNHDRNQQPNPPTLRRITPIQTNPTQPMYPQPNNIESNQPVSYPVFEQPLKNPNQSRVNTGTKPPRIVASPSPISTLMDDMSTIQELNHDELPLVEDIELPTSKSNVEVIPEPIEEMSQPEATKLVAEILDGMPLFMN